MSLFGPAPGPTVGTLGEARLIAQIRRWLGTASPPAPFGIGDDCAVLPPAPSRVARLLTVDPVVYGRHFDDSVPARAVGAKLLKRNLSDIAAMGGVPDAAVVALALDSRVRVRWLESFYRGLGACARRYGVAIAGGDVAQAPGIFAASLTLLGTIPGKARPALRAGASPGDAIYVTGVLGGSLASGHHYRFEPRLKEGAWLARRPEVRAMMDVSDGLAKDIHAMTPRGAEPALFADWLPIRPGSDLSSALAEGEDYELLCAVSAAADREAFERAWARAFPGLPLSRIGAFVRRGRAPKGAIDLRRYRGFEHFRAQ